MEVKAIRTFHDAIKMVSDNYGDYFDSSNTLRKSKVGSMEMYGVQGAAFIFSWDTFKPLQVHIRKESFRLYVFNKKWQQVDIPYNIGRGEFDQLQFLHDMGSFKYKTIKYLYRIRLTIGTQYFNVY